MSMTTHEFAVGGYAVFLALKAKYKDSLDDPETQEAMQAINDVLNQAPDIVRRQGRELYGLILEKA